MGRLNWTRSNQESRIARYGHENVFSDFERNLKDNVTNTSTNPVNKKKKTKHSKEQKHAMRVGELNKYSTTKSLEAIEKFTITKKAKRIRHLSELLRLLREYWPKIVESDKYKTVDLFVKKHKELIETPIELIARQQKIHETEDYLKEKSKEERTKDALEEKYTLKLTSLVKLLGNEDLLNQDNKALNSPLRSLFDTVINVESKSLDVEESLMQKAKSYLTFDVLNKRLNAFKTNTQ